MKKTLCAATLFPSLLIASGMVFASSDGVMQLSDVSETIEQTRLERKDFQAKPLPQGWQPGQHGQQPGGGQPGNNHGGNNGGQPGNNGGSQPPQPPQPVDTTQARNAGIRAGSEAGVREGRRNGYSDGINSGEWDGRRNGSNEGERAGRAAGKRDGWGVNQSAGILNGSTQGQNTGINNGTQAGQRRCYDAGYTDGYNVAFASAKELGLQDAASYSSGYAKGQSDASVTEAANGQKAGYQAGFSQREAELQSALSTARRAGFEKSGLLTRGMDLPIEMARGGYATPEEKRAYDEGYKEGYRNSYRRAYDDAKRQGYNERYNTAYRWAYDEQYAISYRNGYAEGKEQGYQEAYSSAYNSAYSAYYNEYSNREYADQRAQGQGNGRAAGQNEGFAAGCAEQTKRGYNEGYQNMTAQVYPGAFEAGKQSGIAAADKFYQENAVLKVAGVTFYDENNNGQFEASENIMMRAEVKNFGFQASDTVAIVVKSERGEIVLVSDLRADGVGGRANAVLNLNIGKLYDVVAPDADALYVTFSEKGKLVGDARQMYSRTNPNKVGVVSSNGAHVRKGTSGIFSSTITKLDRGVKVLIIGEKNGYFKVRKSAMSGGDWSEGYINQSHVNLQ